MENEEISSRNGIQKASSGYPQMVNKRMLLACKFFKILVSLVRVSALSRVLFCGNGQKPKKTNIWRTSRAQCVSTRGPFLESPEKIFVNLPLNRLFRKAEKLAYVPVQ